MPSPVPPQITIFRSEARPQTTHNPSDQSAFSRLSQVDTRLSANQKPSARHEIQTTNPLTEAPALSQALSDISLDSQQPPKLLTPQDARMAFTPIPEWDRKPSPAAGIHIEQPASPAPENSAVGFGQYAFWPTDGNQQTARAAPPTPINVAVPFGNYTFWPTTDNSVSLDAAMLDDDIEHQPVPSEQFTQHTAAAQPSAPEPNTSAPARLKRAPQPKRAPQTKRVPQEVDSDASTQSSTGQQITEPQKNDILMGRGGAINNRDGNILYRSIIKQNAYRYATATSKNEKHEIARDILAIAYDREPRPRFLKKRESSNDQPTWHVISDNRALLKTMQALRDVSLPIKQDLGLQQRTTKKAKKTPV